MPQEMLAVSRSSTVPLPSGRWLGIAEQGDPQGVPVLFFHGFVGSRLQCPPDGTAVAALRVRLIAVDRPGIGLSDRAPGHTLRDGAADIGDLLDALHLPSCAILGWSAGAPHALACAAYLPQRITRLGLVSPMGGWFVGPGATRHIAPEAREIITLVRVAPWLLGPVFALLRGQMRRHPDRLVDRQLAHLPPRDQATLADPVLHTLLVATLAEAFRQGTGGVVDDTLAVARPWGFRPEAVMVPIHIWQGEADTSVLPALAMELAERLPHAHLTLLPSEGHWLLFTHWHDLLQRLINPV